MVKELHAESDVLSITIPKGYNQAYREIFDADANCLNLHRYGPNYYRFGQHLANMNFAESEDISNSLISTFVHRFHRLVNFALSGNNFVRNKNSFGTNGGTKLMDKLNGKKMSSAGDDTVTEMTAFAASLDNWEKELLHVGHQTVQMLKSWENRSMAKVYANEMITNLKKRRLLLEQHIRVDCMPNNPSYDWETNTAPSTSASQQQSQPSVASQSS